MMFDDSASKGASILHGNNFCLVSNDAVKCNTPARESQLDFREESPKMQEKAVRARAATKPKSHKFIALSLLDFCACAAK